MNGRFLQVEAELINGTTKKHRKGGFYANGPFIENRTRLNNFESDIKSLSKVILRRKLRQTPETDERPSNYSFPTIKDVITLLVTTNSSTV